jgi:hypothetical protein
MATEAAGGDVFMSERNEPVVMLIWKAEPG